MKSHYDVAIIGYGPTGATLANLLGQYGVNVVVLEREEDIYDLPRAVHFDDEIMRIFQTAGIADALLEKVRINPGMRFVDARGNLLLDWPRPAGISKQGWNTSYRFHQPDLERILRQSIQPMANVDTLCGYQVTSVEQNDHSVELIAQETKGQRVVELSADYVVGCDGARSSLRSVIGTEMEDFGFREKWLVVDVELTKPRPDLGDHSIQHCDSQGSATYVRGPGNRRRWELAIKPENAGLDLSNPDVIWTMINRWISPQDAILERHAVYEFRSVVAQDWSSGRLFLAGDAAHQMPPFMGQGMCAGIRDVVNLAWKLAACINSNAPRTLLDSYESERRPHVRQYVQMSMRLGGLINASKTQEALAAAFPQADGSARLESLYPPLGPGLGLGLGLGLDGETQGSQLSQQFQLSSGEKLDDHVGLAPLLLTSHQLEPDDTVGFKGAVISATDEPAAKAYLAEIGAAAIVIRPDRYIFGSVTNLAELDSLISGWNAALGG